MKNAAEMAPNMTARMMMNSNVELIEVPSIGVPEPYAPACWELETFSLASLSCCSMLPEGPPPPVYCAFAIWNAGTANAEPINATNATAAIKIGLFIVIFTPATKYLTFWLLKGSCNANIGTIDEFERSAAPKQPKETRRERSLRQRQKKIHRFNRASQDL